MKQLSGLLDVDITIPTEYKYVVLTLDGAFMSNGGHGLKNYSSIYKTMNDNLRRLTCDESLAQNFETLKTVFNCWLQEDADPDGSRLNTLTELIVVENQKYVRPSCHE